MSKYKNLKKDSFIKGLPRTSIDNSGISKKLRFNFDFFDGNQEAGIDYKDLTKEELIKFFDKIKNFSKEDLLYWRQERCGKGGLKVFVEYGDFPKNSDFDHPPHVPHDAMWARFRIESKFRLIGFLVPDNLHEKRDEETKYLYDRNTFYIVFLDKEHRFYKTEQT